LIEKVKKFCVGNTVTCVIEYIFDGSRLRVHVTDPDLATADLQYANFTLILGGVASPTQSELFADEAKQFVEARLLHRDLKISLHGTDKSGICPVGTIHHPKGSIGVEFLKNGLARVSDWSSRIMNPLDIPAFRVAENNAKVRLWEFNSSVTTIRLQSSILILRHLKHSVQISVSGTHTHLLRFLVLLKS
jgi:staphylococcal nuclease domain-containing protein 1